MRIGLLAAILIFLSSASHPDINAGPADLSIVGEDFFNTLEAMIPVTIIESAEDRFVIRDATWRGHERELVVNVSTENRKGTLFTLMGLPASTMLDAFRISANHGVQYVLPLNPGQAVPCQVIVKSAFSAEVIDVASAPEACNRRLHVAGRAAVSTGQPMANAWITVVVDNVEFATIADAEGYFDLEIYRESIDANVTITAEGKIDDRQSVIHVFSGSVAALLDAHDLSASAWAAEILGRRHKRPMHAWVGGGR